MAPGARASRKTPAKPSSYFVDRLLNVPARLGLSKDAETLLHALDDVKSGIIEEVDLGRKIRLSPTYRQTIPDTINKCSETIAADPSESTSCVQIIRKCTEIMQIASRYLLSLLDTDINFDQIEHHPGTNSRFSSFLLKSATEYMVLFSAKITSISAKSPIVIFFAHPINAMWTVFLFETVSTRKSFKRAPEFATKPFQSSINTVLSPSNAPATWELASEKTPSPESMLAVSASTGEARMPTKLSPA